MKQRENRYLKGLGKRLYSKKEVNDVVKEEPVYSAEEKEKIKELYSKVDNPRHKRAIKQIMEDGTLEKTTQKVDHSKLKKAERKMERRLRDDINKGRIQPAQEDNFMRKIRKHGRTNT